jgi:hypothetical protein
MIVLSISETERPDEVEELSSGSVFDPGWSRKL